MEITDLLYIGEGRYSVLKPNSREEIGFKFATVLTSYENLKARLEEREQKKNPNL